MTNTFLQYQLSQLCQNAIDTCPFTNAVAGADCTKKFCTGFPAYIDVGTCVSLGYDPLDCCTSSDPTTCLENFAHGSGSGSGSGAPNVCASVISILETCFTLTPALSPSASLATSGPSATALASCACYDTDGTFDPSQFDGYASECQASGSAAHPTYFPLVTPLVGFCTNNAGAASPGSSAVAASTTTAMTSLPAAATATSSAQMGSGAVSSGSLATSTSGGQPPVTATGAVTGATSNASPASSAQTTTSKSGGVKVTLRTSAILVLGFSVLFGFY